MTPAQQAANLSFPKLPVQLAAELNLGDPILPTDTDEKLSPITNAVTCRAKWGEYQQTIANGLLEQGYTVTLPRYLLSGAIYCLTPSLIASSRRWAPILYRSASHWVSHHPISELLRHQIGQSILMEISTAAALRTICIPELVRGFNRSGKLEYNPMQRMIDTFDFLVTMLHDPLDHPRVIQQFTRVNGAHRHYGVAGSASDSQRDLFKYTTLNLLYIGASLLPEISFSFRHALCGLSVLVGQHMGHHFEGTVQDFHRFIEQYESEHIFAPSDTSELRQAAIRMAANNLQALKYVPLLDIARVKKLVPQEVTEILELKW